MASSLIYVSLPEITCTMGPFLTISSESDVNPKTIERWINSALCILEELTQDLTISADGESARQPKEYISGTYYEDIPGIDARNVEKYAKINVIGLIGF